MLSLPTGTNLFKQDEAYVSASGRWPVYPSAAYVIGLEAERSY